MMKMIVKASTKYKIKDSDEMQLFLHMKRKGSSTTKNKKQYSRKDKHKSHDY